MGNETNVGTEDTFYNEATWRLKFAWLPRRCYQTGKEIWFKNAYRGSRRYIGGPGGLQTDHRWLARDVWMVEKLKGTI